MTVVNQWDRCHWETERCFISMKASNVDDVDSRYHVASYQYERVIYYPRNLLSHLCGICVAPKHYSTPALCLCGMLKLTILFWEGYQQPAQIVKNKKQKQWLIKHLVVKWPVSGHTKSNPSSSKCTSPRESWAQHWPSWVHGLGKPCSFVSWKWRG